MLYKAENPSVCLSVFFVTELHNLVVSVSIETGLARMKAISLGSLISYFFERVVCNCSKLLLV